MKAVCLAVAASLLNLPLIAAEPPAACAGDRLEGPFLVMTTPVDADGEIDFDTLAKEARFADACGVPGVIWPSGELVPYAISREELIRGMEVLAETLAGRRTMLAVSISGRDTAHSLDTVRAAEAVAEKYAIEIAYLARPADDCRTQEGMERHYSALGAATTHPVIVQTHLGVAPCPQPDVELLVRLAKKYPQMAFIKEEGSAVVTNDRIEALVANKPVIRKVFGGFGGWSWKYQLMRLGVDGLVTQRLMYGDALTFVFDEMRRGDPEGAGKEAFTRLLALWNLRNAFPGNELRGPQLHIFKKRGVFKNLLSLAADGTGRKVDRVELTDKQIAELDELYADLAPFCSRTWSDDGHEPSFREARLAAAREMADRLPRVIAEQEKTGDENGRIVAEMAREDLRRIEELCAIEAKSARLDPLAPDLEPLRLNVRDFGARGDGVADDSAAFDRAIAALKACDGRPAILDIPAGDYLFSAKGRQSQFRAEGLANCVIRGASPVSTRFVFGDYAADGVELFACTNVTFANVDLAYAETPFSQGRVVAFDKVAGTAEIDWTEGTLAPDDCRFATRPNVLPCAIFDESGRRVKGQDLFFTRSASRIGERRYRVGFDTSRKSYAKAGLKPGWTLAIADRDNTFGMVRARESFLCNFDHVWVRNSRAAAFALVGASQTTLWRCRIIPRKRGFALSSNADGLFGSRGLFVAQCEFSNTNDDGINSLAFGRMVKRVERPRTLVDDAVRSPWAVGDPMVLVSAVTGEYRYFGRVMSVRRSDDDPKWIATTFDTPLPDDVRSLEDMGLVEWTEKDKRDVVHGRRKVSAMADILYRPYTRGVGLVVSGCRFSSVRGTGVVAQCPDAIVENCWFEHINAGVELTARIDWQEGPAPYNAVVRNCRFRDVEKDVSSVCHTVSGQGTIEPVRAVTIEGNRR